MRWYQRQHKGAMPLPKATNYPANPYASGLALTAIDDMMTNEQASEINEQHPNMDYLGHGRYGVAYETAPGTVVKLTRDPSEAAAAKRLMANPAPCIVNVLGVEALRGRLWKITTEKVLPLDEESKPFVEILSEHTDNPAFPELNKVVEDYCRWNRLRADELGEDWWARMRFHYARYSEMINCMISHNLSPSDAHQHNVGVRGDKYVMMDLGQMI